jgi:SAM-dependent methyltransferase
MPWDDIRRQIEGLKEFIDQYRWLTDFFAIDFLTTNFYDQVPADWKVLEQVEFSVLNEIVSNGFVDPSWPLSLQEFIRNAHSLPIHRNCTLEPLKILPDIRIGMNEKKVIETSFIASEIRNLCLETKATHIIDFGCGQGYLSTVLAYQLGYHVVGIDCDVKQVSGGEQRARRIHTLLEQHGHTVSGTLQFYTKRIEWRDGIDAIVDLIERELELQGHRWVICGLHTCGDLASTMIKGMVQSRKESVVGLVSIGCCYQLLTENIQSIPFSSSDESFSTPINQDRVRSVGFPLSQMLYPYELGLHARMVACSASQRWIPHSPSVKESLRRLYYRSVLQKLMEDENIIPPTVGYEEALKSNRGERAIKKMGKVACADPVSYTRSALSRLGCDRSIPDGTVLATFEWYSFAKKQIALVWTLRGLLGDPIESLILLDRYSFALEQGFPVKMVAMVEPFVSPRNMALIIKRPL